MNKKIKLEKIFIIVSLFVGTLLVLLVPPYNSPDEETHFMYAYEISKGNILPSVENNKSGHYIPNSIFDSIDKNKKIVDNADAKYSYSEIKSNVLYTNDYEKKGFWILNVQNQPIIAYLAPALGTIVASNLEAYTGGKVSSDVLLQFARFFSLLIYSIIGYFSIKITPKFKNSFFAILLLPLSVFLRSMVSYDGFILVVVAIVLANILRLIDSKDVMFKKRDFLFFIITGFALLNVKTIYSIVFLGLLAIPDSVFNGKKNKWKNIVSIIIVILSISIARRLLYIGLTNESNPLFGKQISFIINHPFQYFKIMIHNIFSQLKIMSWWMIGVYGCLDTFTPLLIQFLIKIYLFFIILMDAFYEKINISKKIKFGYFCLIILSVFAIYTYMYIYWTTLVTNIIGGGIITGVQGRYYIPLLFLLPIVLNNNIISKLKNESKIKKILDKSHELFINNHYYFTMFSLIFMVIIIILRFYI